VNTLDFQQLLPTIEEYAPQGTGGLIGILQKAQDMFGYLPEDLILFIAKETRIPAAKVYGVVTFYAQFRTKPIGKHHIMVCQGTACHVVGSRPVEDAIADYLGINEGETTADGLFTLSSVACLGCCSLAPAMMIGAETYGKLTSDSAVEIIKELRS